MQRIKVLASASLLLSIIWLNCCNEPEPDPCRMKEPVSAEFGIYQALGDSLFLVDTVLVSANDWGYSTQNIVFRAKQTGHAYDWTVGVDPRTFEQRSFGLDFKYDALGIINVTLAVTGEPDVTCFPDDKGLDTLTKSFVLVPKEDYPFAYEGTFVGYETHDPGHSFEIQIKDFGRPNPWPSEGYYGTRIYNLPEGCGGNEFTTNNYSHEIGGQYKFFYTDYSVAFQDFGCTYEVREIYGRYFYKSDSLIIDYLLRQPDFQYVPRRFIGKRK